MEETKDRAIEKRQWTEFKKRSTLFIIVAISERSAKEFIEINNERPQDNKENQTGGSTRPNNNIENLINRNVTRNVQENRRVNILQSSPHSQPSRELADALTMREACNIVKGPHRNCAWFARVTLLVFILTPSKNYHYFTI